MWRMTSLVAVLGAAGLQAQEIVELPGEDRPVSPDLELVYRIGSAAAAAEWEQFAAIRNVAFDGAGNLYLLDGTRMAATSRVVMVGASGAYMRDFGRAGEGPGEFRAPTQLVVWEDGLSLVSDMMHGGYHVFGPGGEFEHMVRETGSMFGVRSGLRPERTGSRTLIGRSERSVVRLDMSLEEVEDRVLVETWDPRGHEEQGQRTGGIEDLIREVWGFEPELLFDALPPGGVALSDSSVYAIKVTDPSGTVSSILRRAIRPVPVTEEMRRAERERRLEAERNRRFTSLSGGEPSPQFDALVNDLTTARRAAIENMRFFPEVPVIAALRSTWDGALWVQRSAEPGSVEPGPIDVITPDGQGPTDSHLIGVIEVTGT